MRAEEKGVKGGGESWGAVVWGRGTHTMPRTQVQHGTTRRVCE